MKRKYVRILILEDDLLTLSRLSEGLAKLEEKENIEISIMILSEYLQAQKYINDIPSHEFDIILLDRDCKLAGSFHILDIERFGPEKIISISSVPEYNEDAKKRGINKIVLKEYNNLDNFTEKVMLEILKLTVEN